jgi:cytochrome c oxidase subunit 3
MDSTMKISEDLVLKEKVSKNLLYVGIFSIVMLFAGLTSAYIVRQADGQWLRFTLPVMFWVSSGIILVSSITMHWAVISVRKNKLTQLTQAVGATLLLGILFGVSQIYGWGELLDGGIYFAGKSANPSGSFIYALSGLHLFHILSGVIALIVVLVKSMSQKYTAENSSGVRLCATYWHFLDGLWIYLFVFLVFMQ